MEARAEWTTLPAATVGSWAGGCTGMRFVSSTTGYAIDGNNLTPTVMKTTNGGTSWSGGTVALNSVGASGQTTSFVLDAETVFLANSALGVGGNDRVARTTNSGANWTVSSLTFNGTAPAAVKLYAIHAINATTAWAGGETLSPSGTALFKTTNGTTWSQVATTGLTEKVRTIHFFDANNGVIGGVNDIFRTTDGGSTWTNVHTVVAPNRFSFVSATVGFFLDNQPSVHKTENAGQSWSVVANSSPGCPLNLTSGAQFYAFADAQHGFVSCSGGGTSANKFRKTENGGASWSDEAFPAGWPTGTNLGAGCVAYAGAGGTLRFAGAYGSGEKRFLTEGVGSPDPGGNDAGADASTNPNGNDAGGTSPGTSSGGNNNSASSSSGNAANPGGSSDGDDGGCAVAYPRSVPSAIGAAIAAAFAVVSAARRRRKR